MATTIPDVRVTQVEAGQGFAITCNQCPGTRAMRSTRIEADLVAADHQRDHARPGRGAA